MPTALAQLIVNLNHKSQSNILQPDWSLLVLLNLQDSFHRKQD